mmetsp:Transcript_27456/g.32202  ORF Transcript_27456/g.32202 Transcript_27456/m.32202 type:complete len:114 (+) Transcript_27456:33-374(+)
MQKCLSLEALVSFEVFCLDLNVVAVIAIVQTLHRISAILQSRLAVCGHYRRPTFLALALIIRVLLQKILENDCVMELGDVVATDGKADEIGDTCPHDHPQGMSPHNVVVSHAT